MNYVRRAGISPFVNMEWIVVDTETSGGTRVEKYQEELQRDTKWTYK